MSLFQNIVVKKYINEISKEELDNAWEKFQKNFQNPIKQENIRQSKEEQYQEGFLRDLFVEVLNYSLKPAPLYNLTTELKNLKGAKKADGAILKDNNAIAVIELKSTKVTDLEKIENQAFNYKNNHRNCRYVITSNFEKIRLYIDNTIDFIEFNLFNMTKDIFYTFYLLLNKNNLFKNLPIKIKLESNSQEEAITNKLYQNYSLFKKEVFKDILENNSGYDSLLLYQKTQKFLDRILFILFAEDSGLIPANTSKAMLEEWDTAQELKIKFNLYDHIKRYFNFLDKGYKDENTEIFAYNGGLFKPDEILDNIHISNNVLYVHINNLRNYDFNSEVDVNILGHIFENSLNELEEIKAELKNQKIEKKDTKRKKDGIYYTPKYITNYIVKNTLGTLCTEKKYYFEINDEDFNINKKIRKNTQTKLLNKLKNYRNWLLNIKICDPACGSGAFLNEALSFLIKEHQYIDELESKIFGNGFIFQEVRNHILENNLYGVDINEESIEIAKLSLWLRTAEPKRKLNDLSKNILCGNSLISDQKIAGEKAFVWEKSFPQIFNTGGFDIIIGNPPYGAKLEKQIQNYLNNYYIKGGSETVISFLKLSYENLLKENGSLGFIIPKSFSYASNYAPIREFLLNEISEIVDCKKVWKEVKLEQVMLFINKGKSNTSYKSCILKENQILELSYIHKNTFEVFEFYLNGINDKELTIGKKIRNINHFINNIATNSRGGMLQKTILGSGEIPVLGGAQIQRTGIISKKGFVNKSDLFDLDKIHIKNNSILVQNIVAHIENPTDHIKIIAAYPTNKDFVILDTINQLTFNEKYNSKVFWLILNSKLINWYAYRFIFGKAIRTMHFDNAVTSRLPIPHNFDQEPFIKIADKLLKLYEDFNNINLKFSNSLNRRFDSFSNNETIKNWYMLDYQLFIKELNKKKIHLTLREEADWEDYFLDEKSKAISIKKHISDLLDEVDSLVYKIYSLTSHEIEIITNC